MRRWWVGALILVLGCTEPNGGASEPVDVGGGAAWLLEGSDTERFARVARHLRGFDVAMVEVGYRYSELYWAGQDENWGYAEYQLGKIRTAIANGVERRPARAASARMIEAPLASVERAITTRDRAAFDRDFDQLTSVCNACHVAERVAFVTVAIPTQRVSPVRAAAPPGDAQEEP